VIVSTAIHVVEDWEGPGFGTWSVYNEAISGGKYEQNAGIWIDEGRVAHVARVGLCWGGTTGAVAHRRLAACVVCGVVAGVVPGMVVVEVCPPNRRGTWQ